MTALRYINIGFVPFHFQGVGEDKADTELNVYYGRDGVLIAVNLMVVQTGQLLDQMEIKEVTGTVEYCTRVFIPRYITKLKKDKEIILLKYKELNSKKKSPTECSPALSLHIFYNAEFFLSPTELCDHAPRHQRICLVIKS